MKIRTTTTVTTTAVATLVTSLLLALAGTLTSAAGAATGPEDDPTGWLRVGHLSPDTPKAEVRLTPFAGGRPTTLTEASFGDLSDYERIPVGTYTVALVPADDADAPPMLSRSVEVTEGSARTVIATGEGDDVRATVLDDDLTPPAAGQAKVRLVSAASGVDAVDATVVDGPRLAAGLGTGTATGYAEVAAQDWDVTLSAAGDRADEGAASTVGVRAGGVYTLVALDAPGGGLELRAVMDSAGSTGGSGAMPTGGVDAGAGGLADQGAGPAVPAALGAGALLLVAAAGLVAVRRRAAA
ncbi:DUF4397 domain-containing protein [Nocardioides marmoraquaticus]